MAKDTKIQWADATFNPWIGCTKVSAGCAHCYAEGTTRARVLRARGQETWGKGAKRARTSLAYWKQPLSWNRAPNRMRIFPSLCDWLDDEVPTDGSRTSLNLIHVTQNLNWLLLTKRPENWKNRIVKAGPFLANGFPVDWIHEGNLRPTYGLGPAWRTKKRRTNAFQSCSKSRPGFGF